MDILDCGSGLAAGDERKLLDRFRRGEGSDQQGGTGFGLAIVKGFAGAMELEVAGANRPDGPGSQFTVVWPEALICGALPAGVEA